MLNDLKNFIAKYERKKPEGAIIAVRKTDTISESINHNFLPKNLTIAICNQKGGCAKTTTAINLSACLAQKGYKVLLVDLDPQANASLGLGIDLENLERSIYDVLINNLSLESIIQRSSCVDNLDIAAANSVLSGAQLELADMLGRENILTIALRKLRLVKSYDFIFLDCSPSLNLITINALVAANSVLIPIQTHYYSLEGMKELFSTIDIVRERLNFELEILGILATLFDTRTKVSHQMLEQIRDYFKDMVFKTIIHNNVKLCEAPIYKKPIHLYDQKSQGAQDYWALTEEIIALTGYGGRFAQTENQIPQTQQLNATREATA
jgi:chromosome partitioning protein